jgi:menaquinone-dependent protoporphyrinogen oxidase
MPCKILVTASSRHGATDELAHVIGEAIAAQGLDVDIRRMDEVDTVFPYDALVIGSAVYMGRWTSEARTFLDLHEGGILGRATWLFSSGPIGDLGAEPFAADELVQKTNAREHHLFGGRLLKRSLGFKERALAGLIHAQDGDFREWAAVVAWATAIARSLADDQAGVASRS